VFRRLQNTYYSAVGGLFHLPQPSRRVKKGDFMPHTKSFIPGAGPAYDTFFKNICDYVNGHCASPSAAYLPTLKLHTPAETAARNAAYRRSKKVLGRFVQIWFRGFPEIVTEEDLLNMGIPPSQAAALSPRPSSLLHLWIFAPPITQKSRLSGLLSEFAG
jgi:hypothetical protein